MQQIMEREVPLYRIKAYDNFLFRVTKRLFNPAPASAKRVRDDEQEQDEHVGKFASALSRARNTVRDVILCNRWEYFVTLTFDGARWDRYDLQARVKELMQWIQNENKKGANIRYVLVPEFHKDGAVHLHGVMSGITSAPCPADWPKSVNQKEDGTYYDCWSEFSERYGYSSVERINNSIAVGFYCSKYITKSMAATSDFVGVHTYYRSRGLNSALPVGELYHPDMILDKCCKFENDFYGFGFFKCEDTGVVVDFCDEVSDMYKNYVITDPVTGDLVAVVGGDTEDQYVQEILEEFMVAGMACEHWNFPD